MGTGTGTGYSCHVDQPQILIGFSKRKLTFQFELRLPIKVFKFAPSEE
jgi:hypothetical protein